MMGGNESSVGRASARANRRSVGLRLGAETLEGRVMPSAGLARPAAEIRALPASQAQGESANDRVLTRMEGLLLWRPLNARRHEQLVRAMDDGVSRAAVAARLLRSDRGRRVEVLNTYQVLLGRRPTPRELRSSLATMGRGEDQLAVIRRVAGSREFFRARGLGTNGGYVEALAARLLGRAPTAAESRSWVAMLDRGGSRAGVVARVVRTPAFAEATARRLAAHASPGSPDPALAARVAKILSGRGAQRFTRAKAAVLGSAPLLETVTKPVVAPPRVRADSPSINLPLTPGFSLATNWSGLSLPAGLLGEVQAVGGSPQGKFFVATNQSGLLAYDPATTALTTIWGGSATSVAPISDTAAWVVGTAVPGQGPTMIGSVSQAGGLTVAAALPAGDVPAQVGASPDGTVWALGQSGQVYAYARATDSWAPRGNGGFAIQQLSVGSATNIWASGTDGGKPVVLNWDGAAWAVDKQFGGAQTVAVAAGADGSVWGAASILKDNFVFLRPPGGAWAPVPHQTPPGAVFLMAATGRDRMLALSASPTPALNILSFGVVDRPAVPFPTPTPNWAALYADVMQDLKVTAPGGIRALYDSTDSDLTTWYTKLTNGSLAVPLGVDAEEWGAVLQQLASEVNSVIGLNNLFTPLNSLNLALAVVAKDALDDANANLKLTTPQSQSTASLFIVGLFEAALNSVGSVVSGGAAVAASFISSAVDNVIADLTNSGNPGPSTKLQLEAAKLDEAILGVFTSTGSAYGQQQQTIARDYGMLTAVGRMVNSGTWTWDDAKGATLAAAAKNSFGLFYYQALMPLAWQIVNIPTYICSLEICPNVASPDYDTYEVIIKQGTDFVQEEIYFINALGASTESYNNPGPYPLKPLIDGILATGASKSDLFSNLNGWDLPFFVGR